MEFTERLALPFILPGQAQKEVSHNEALQLLDTLVAAAVESGPLDEPPAAPVEGTCYLIGEAAAGEWSGFAAHIGAYSAAGWRFIAPTQGMQLWVKSGQVLAIYGASGWEIGSVRAQRVLIDGLQVLAERADGIENPSGGATVDTEARSTLAQILAVLRHHGLISS